MSKEVAEEYLSSLADLTVNYKPLILMLTMLADENSEHAPAIVQAIESHIEKVPPAVKLPILYLIDSIVKNCSQVYLPLFSQKIVQIFVSVFEKVDDATRAKMFKLRETWTNVFPSRMLFALDLKLKEIDSEWPLSAPLPATIHLNPKFLQGTNNSTAAAVRPPEVSNIASRSAAPSMIAASATPCSTATPALTGAVLDQVLKHHQILCGLQQEKLELELQKVMLEQQKQLKEESSSSKSSKVVCPSISEEAVKLLSQKAVAKPKAVVMPPSAAAVPKSSSFPPCRSVWTPDPRMISYNFHQNYLSVIHTSVMATAVNSVPSKTKIAPANTRLIEAAKSRDPRIARQQQQLQQQTKPPAGVTLKEQEIYSRQLAMLKTPIVGQVAGLPVQRVLSESNVKSHITIDLDSNRSKVKTEAKSKRQSGKESSKSETSSRSRSKQSSPKESKSSPSKSSKSSASYTKSSKTSSPKTKRSSSHSDRSRTPPKGERNSSSSSGRIDSPKSKSKHSSRKYLRAYSPKALSKKSSSKSPRSSSPKSGRSNSAKSTTSSPKADSPISLTSPESTNSESDSFEKVLPKITKKVKEKRGINIKTVESIGKGNALPLRNETSTETDTLMATKLGRMSLPLPVVDERKSPILSEKKEPVVRKDEFISYSYLEQKVNSDALLKNKDTQESIIDNKSSKSDNRRHLRTATNSKRSGKQIIELELIESSPSPEPPPPPIISMDENDMSDSKKDDMDANDLSEEEKSCKKELMGFKGLKGASKGRNYIRRNRELSASPQDDVTGDVDLRILGPPEKQPRLLFKEENNTDIEKSLVNISGKDVDLRQLTAGRTSPSKKRLSTDGPGDEPPKKKNKSGVYDELFEDVDLRVPVIPKLKTNIDRLGSPPPPPPPPLISNGPAVPQVAAVAPLVVEPPKASVGDVEAIPEQINDSDSDSSKVRSRRSWADVKVKKETESKSMVLSSQLELELGPRKDANYSQYDEKDDKGLYRDRVSPRGALDRLGRPLLYNKLPNDPRARRESLTLPDGRDTDMRRLGGIMDRDDIDINVNMIVAEAEDQVRNGTMTVQQYNEIVKQVIRVNEVQKLREAQKKDRQENRRMQHHHRSRRSPPNRFGPPNRNSPPYRHDDDRRDRRPFNDVDDRMQVPSWRGMQRSDMGSGFSRANYHSGGNRNQYDVLPVDHRSFDDCSMKNDAWDDERHRFRRMSHLDKLAALDNRPRDVMSSERTHDCVDVPHADTQALEKIAKDPMKSINIDGTPRDIRFYGDTAVVMLSWDDPKEISFEDGVRRVAIGDLNLTCALNSSYVMFLLNGNPHRIRFGAPTRELYIDGEFYEAHFGGPSVPVQIDGLTYLVQVEGPPPQVKIGEKRTDLICGRVNMIVDATAMLPLYLDAKPQRFDLRSRPYVCRLVNSLKTLLVNEVPVDIQFGGGCRQICGYGNLHFLRLSTLPTGVVPGNVLISNMETIGSVATDNLLTTGGEPRGINAIQQPLNIIVEGNTSDKKVFESPTDPIGSNREQSGPLDILTSLMSNVSAPQESGGYSYKVENREPLSETSPTPPIAETTSPVVALSTPATVPPIFGTGLNINDLFQKLVATGIVQTTPDVTTNQEPEVDTNIKPIDITNANSLREKQPALINLLYSGIQCSSCGVRFLAEETVKYSRHLDWHFRQNRREKDAARKGQSRKWYYDVSDWIQFEEIEDLEERAQSWFETEATNQVEETTEQEEIKSVLAPPGDEVVLCDLCRDRFETFYNEDKEEWHLKPCMLVEDKYYHPLCYEDLINAPEETFAVDPNEASKDEDASLMNTESEIKLEGEGDKNEEEPQEDSTSEIKKEVKEENVDLELEENIEDDVKAVIENLICCIERSEEVERQEAEELAKIRDEEDELLVLENVVVEHKKNIIDVDLIEKLDDDEDDIVYTRRSDSPITLIPVTNIKQEPVEEMESPIAIVDQTYTNVVSSIDGNVEIIDAPPVAQVPTSKIKITFSKPIATEQQSEKQAIQEQPETKMDDDEDEAEEVEPEPLPLKPKKPALAEQELVDCPMRISGCESSGLCTIM